MEFLYDLGLQNWEVAVELNLNESCICQVKQRAISKLRCCLQA
jgi:DNA-directed RNA polymerase specialized sigma subunit